ncbi:MAG: prephenate dehydratase [Gammaproteobacteria bacterium]|nr:MAG: prephenate dehydratase [Gammaproteobacteria bacterium]
MSDQEEKELGALRVRIDDIDVQIQALLNERARCALQVAEVKSREAGSSALFYRPEREAQVLRKVMERNQGPLHDETVARLFREVMSACLALENPMQIGYLGPEGTFTHAAVHKHFGHAVDSISLSAIDEVFREVESGSVHYGIVPVENSTEGVVNHTLDSFLDSALVICGEVELRIHQHFLVQPGQEDLGGGAKQRIKRIYSHQQSLGQCRKWLDTHWAGVERVAVSSNAEAARLVQSDPSAAAIAGEMAAEKYGLVQLAENIEDNPNNTTRFLIIGRSPVPPCGKDKTSILISTRNRPGALYRLLEPFHELGISLTKIETRPSKVGNWSYVFFIDFEGHIDDPEAQKLWIALESEVAELRCLGSYPKAVL